MTATAKLVKKIPHPRADQRLYELSPPFQREAICYACDHRTVKAVTHVVVSAAWTQDHGNETYIFEATPDGEIVDWGEMGGSFIGGLDHALALHGLGYEVAP